MVCTCVCAFFVFDDAFSLCSIHRLPTASVSPCPLGQSCSPMDWPLIRECSGVVLRVSRARPARPLCVQAWPGPAALALEAPVPLPRDMDACLASQEEVL